MELNIAEIIDKYDINLISSNKIKSIHRCETNKGIKSLKEVQTSKEKVIFEYYIKEHLFANGFTNINRFEINKETNLPYVEMYDKCYVLSDWIEGRECDLGKEEEMKLALTTLAELHIASKGFDIENIDDIVRVTANSYEIERNNGICIRDMIKNIKTDIGKLEDFYEKRLSELVRYKKKLSKEIILEDFDKLYYKNVDAFIEDAKFAIEVLKKSKYKEIVDYTLKEKMFCHHDYAFHNIIINENKELFVIDFEYANYEIKMYDLANVLKRRMRKCNWNIDEAIKMIKIYSSKIDVSKDELVVLFAMLVFPQKFWRIINRHYNGKKIWKMENDVSKIQIEIDEEKYHKDFIQSFKKYIV